ncbi:response regulator [Halobiforma nitratireducens]|uniref:response regulator n=1 Tax=Halobiforma nitratireducens TaxID=130048 RepID=UPI0006776BD4|nr:response regulator [Halobiforma nitratireducens]
MSNYTPDEPVDVLLIEDNPGDVRLTKEAFRSTNTDIEFHVLTDGEAASKHLRSCAADADAADDDTDVDVPDLVLLDLNLPRVDGFSILETLSAEFDHPPPPVLVLSSSEAREDVVESYERAANAYLSKPDDPAEFTSMARAIEEFWIDSAQHPPAPS